MRAADMSGAETTGTTGTLHVAGLSKSFGATRVLDEVSFAVEPGRFLVLLGPSGSGKTTLLRCLAGIERADAGSIRLGGRTLAEGRTHLPPDKRELAMVFQDYALWPHMTAAGNVGYALRRRRPGREESATKVASALTRVGLGEHAERYPHQLSGGQQQRVALARALVAEPGLLLFDEPLSNLDADLRERLRVEIATLTRESGATVVYITHDQAEAFALADTVGVLEQGRLVQLASPEDVYQRPASPFVARFTGLAGELAGRVADTPHLGRVLCATAAGPLVATAIGTHQDGAAVQLLLRPAAVVLAAEGGPDADAPSGSLAGTVADTAYRGRGYDHVVELSDGTRLTGVFDRRPRPRGTRVRVTVDPDGCFAYPASASQAEPDAVTPINRTPVEVS
ncbi:ABC transporter ATP-binding protein [Streptacidiphilus pinicola]|uniref:ABC-type quaternary amine transporter n=1 Tax=Streptacidiphilus pinicola TaxID=2219663 RepID=A0A2X0IS01_9ACTN|nr:ABC transporter ATP-binding protein [Streptacidiphilus pinicola]RAG87357.1 ABC transporter ATP-binding protein [Streptacidiphilus pinicola]